MKNITRKVISCLMAIAVAVAFTPIALAGADSSSPTTAAPQLTAAAHVQNIGDQAAVTVGVGDIATVGTSGQSLRVESISLSLANSEAAEGEDYQIRYSAHVQNIGWQDWAADGAIAGTSGQSLRLEAFKIELNERLAATYDVWYRVHAQNFGWMAWTSNGSLAGSSGYAYRLEAVQVVLLPKGSAAPAATDQTYDKAFTRYEGDGSINYSAQVQNVGWQTYVSDGATSGTTGQNLRLEALKINTTIENLSVEYSAHVQNIGWQDYVADDTMIGTVGQGLRVEAFKIRLTGSAAENYDIWYRVHDANWGWMGWTSNDGIAGSVGCAQVVQAVEIQLLPKGSEAPGDTTNPYYNAPTITYSGQVQNIGWTSEVTNGALCGTSGQNLRLESLKVSYGSDQVSGGISYRGYVQNIGWQDWVSDGTMAGTEGQSLRMEAINIKLTGDAADVFDIYYRVHVQNWGWTGWACNGANCGSSGLSYRIEAIEIQVVGKSAAAPGSTAYTFSDETGFMNPYYKYIQRANQYGSSTGWLMLVDCTANNVVVLNGSSRNWKIYAVWRCGTGMLSMPTVKGVFSIYTKGYSFIDKDNVCKCFYYSGFYGNYLFHSILYQKWLSAPDDRYTYDANLGGNISHGCVRLATQNAKWVYDNIPIGTTVVSF